MGKVETIKTMVPKYDYKTTDGEMFDNLNDAQIHQDVLDGTKKHCEKCGGRGSYPENNFIDGGHSEWMEPCETCSGKGYLELKWG